MYAHSGRHLLVVLRVRRLILSVYRIGNVVISRCVGIFRNVINDQPLVVRIKEVPTSPPGGIGKFVPLDEVNVV